MVERVFTVETCGVRLERKEGGALWNTCAPRKVVFTTGDLFEALREYDVRSRALPGKFDSEYRRIGHNVMAGRGYAVELWQRGGNLDREHDPDLLQRYTYDMRDYIAGIDCLHTAELYEDNDGVLHMFSLVNGAPVWARVYGIGEVAEAAADWLGLTVGRDLCDWECAYEGERELKEAYDLVVSRSRENYPEAVKIGDENWWRARRHALDVDALGATGKAMAKAIVNDLYR